MKKRKLLSFILVFAMIVTTMACVNPAVYAANGDYTGEAGFTVNAYPDGVRMNMIPVSGATKYEVYMSTSSGLSTFAGVPCLFSSSSYQPYAYFTNGDMDKIATTTAISINPSTTYYFYYVTNGTTVTTQYEATTQATGISWTSEGNYDTSWYSAGSTTFTITTAAQLAGLAVLVNGGNRFSGITVNLGASIDVSAYPWTAIGTYTTKAFWGTFDGKSNVISGIYINATTNSQGLFGYTNGAAIKNLGVVNGFVQSSSYYVGGVLGNAAGGSVTNCYNTGSVTGSSNNIGGVVGSTTLYTTITNCYNTGNVTATGANSQWIGGVVADASGTVQNCYNTGTVTATGTSSSNVGGVTGRSNSTTQGCYNTGAVTATGTSSSDVGGVTGSADGVTTFTNCYNTGAVTATGTSSSNVAGVVGRNNSTTLTKCYNLGDITGNANTHGVAGMTNMYIETSYAHCKVNGTTTDIYYNASGSTSTTAGNGTFTNDSAGLANIGAAFCPAPTQYTTNGVFSASNPVNRGYPVLKAFGYTGDDSSFDTEFNIDSSGNYLISNAYQMDLVRYYLGTANNTKVFKLAGNIDISPAQYNQTFAGNADGADSWKPVGTTSSSFFATFDGAEYSVSGLYINSTSTYQGFFGSVSHTGGIGGIIKNVGINGALVSGNGYTGGVVGSIDTGCSVKNCYNIVSVRSLGNRGGGVVGDAWDSTYVQNCYNAGNVTTGSANYVGGVVGTTIGSVQYCYNIGSVAGTWQMAYGGIVGYAWMASVQNCYNTGSIATTRASTCGVGGIIGYDNGASSVQNCYNRGSVTNTGNGSSSIGGIVGLTKSSSLKNCYNTGSVTDTGDNSNSIGGIVGYASSASSCFQYCYNTGSVTDTATGSKHVGGVVGNNAVAATITNCYYTGYIGGVGNATDTTAADTAGTIPFAKLVSNTIAAGGNTTITENNASVLNGTSNLGGSFAVSFPSGYSSSNTSVATVLTKTVTGVTAGNTNITGTITITQDNLNMSGTGWLATTCSVTAQVSIPLTVKSVTGIAINTQPGNLSYTEGQTLDLSGLAVTLTFNDSSTQNVALTDFATWGITTSPANGTSLSVATHNSTPVTVICNGISTSTNSLTVTPAPFTATVTVNKDGAAWTSSTSAIALSTSDTSLSGSITATVSSGVYNFTGLDPLTTYFVWDTDLNSYTGQSVTASSTSAMVDYYTVTLSSGTGIETVTGNGVYLKGSSPSISATVSTGYTWSKWTKTADGTDVSTTQNYTIPAITSALNYTATTTSNAPPSAPLPIILTDSLLNGTVGSPYSKALSAVSTGVVTWCISSGTLPAGLSLDMSTGTISGTPTTTETSTFTVQASNSNGSSTKVLSITIVPASFTATVTVNKDGTAWTGSTPAIALSTSDTSLSGSVTATVSSSVYNFTGLDPLTTYFIWDTDLNLYTGQSVTASSTSATVNYYTVTLSSGTGIETVTGNGVYLKGSSPSISATVSTGYTWSKWTKTADGTDVSTAQTYTIPTITSALNYTATTTSDTPPSAPLPIILTDSLSNGTVGTPYSETLSAVSTGVVTWCISSGTLPAGLSLDMSTDTITGTPTTAGTSTFTVQASNSNGNSTKVLSITVSQAPFTATVTVNKDGAAWTSSTPAIALSTSDTSLSASVTATVSSSVYNFTGLDPLTTYYVWDTDLNLYTGQSVTASSTSATVDYYTVTLSSGTGIGTVTGNGVYLKGSSLSISATVSTGYIWSKWTKTADGTDVSTTQNYTISGIASKLDYMANAIQSGTTIPATYTLNIVAGSGGKVSSAGGTFAEGALVSITATSDVEYSFSGWTSSNGGTFEDVSSASTTFTMPGNATTITANWTENTYALTVDLDGGNGTTANGTYSSGAVINIDAGTKSGYKFKGWTSSNAGTFEDVSSASTTFTMPGNATTVTANWTKKSSGGSSQTQQANDNTTVIVANNNTTVIVDGKDYSIGSENKDGSSTTLTVDQSKLTDDIATASDKSSAILSVSDNTNVITQLVLRNVEDMAKKDMTLTVQTGNVSYNLNTAAIDTAKINASLGTTDSEHIPFNVSIHNSNAVVTGATVVVAPVEFTITATYNEKTVNVDTFNSFVERTIEITADDAKKITTAVVVEQDGSLRHVPTKVTIIEGKYYAVINSLTNSTYTLIWHPMEFKDVTNHWAKTVVNDMGSRMVIKGIGDDNFAPDMDITRAEFAAIIVRGLGLKPGMGTNPFNDVKAGDWYMDFVKTAYGYKIINGYADGSFKPDGKITREEAMAMITRAMNITKLSSGLKDGETDYELSKFNDMASVADWAKDSAAACVKAGIICGEPDGTISPNKDITRAETAAVIRRLLQKSNLI